MFPTRTETRHLGIVASLAAAARDMHYRSVVIAGLQSAADRLAENTAMDLCRCYCLASSHFRFAADGHQWRQYLPEKPAARKAVAAMVRSDGTEELQAEVSALSPMLPDRSAATAGELASGMSFASLKSTLQRLEEESSMLVVSGPAVTQDADALVALAIVPRLILAVPVDADRGEVADTARMLKTLGVDIVGTVLTGYRNPLPRWLDFLLGYR